MRAGRPNSAEVAQIRALIEAAGGKDHAERAAREAYASALAALEAAGLEIPPAKPCARWPSGWLSGGGSAGMKGQPAQ